MRPGDDVVPDLHLAAQYTMYTASREHGAAHIRLVEVLPSGAVGRHARAVLREVLMKAGAEAETLADAEIVVSELAANADRHAAGSYELRILDEAGVPAWCEVVDGTPDFGELATRLDRLRTSVDADMPSLAENGRGLLLALRLSGGDCAVYPARSSSTGALGKAVGFALGTSLLIPVLFSQVAEIMTTCTPFIWR
ncbi:ATP-binding protein [Sphaerisporangium sp. NPDC005288]|uniref:ATP-binding protein n=1 Tax=Sphaerisporangium sp. NPDC005288 TaxID=3155114 RepID=UPI0033B1F496